MHNRNIHLPRTFRRLLVMGGLAAANHHLKVQAEAIRDAFPLLINDEVTRAECELVMAALLDSSHLTSADYDPMQTIVEGLGPHSDKR